MMFSTKAEYGVRLMVELGRREGQGPVSLAEIAEAEFLPLPYLEHLTARLRRAGLVESKRGAHGGYMLARPADRISMAEIVEALEGSIAPVECITAGTDSHMMCSHEHDPGGVCTTKVLWTKVQGSIVRTLQETSLSELVERPPLAPGKPATKLPVAATS